MSLLGAVCFVVVIVTAARFLVRWLHADDLRGRVVLITGGSRGLGLVLARTCLRAGTRVAICARDERELARALRELRHVSRDILACRCDVTNPDDVRELAGVVRQRWGAVDALINNAGVIQVGPVDTMTLEDYDESMRTHFWAALYTIREVLPDMRTHRHGRIVNICSIGGIMSLPHLIPYSAGKFALAGLSQGLRAELMKDGVTVTTVYPGLMRTGSARNATFKSRHRDEYAWFSISDSLPLLTISATRAAQRIVWALRCGDGEVVLTLPAMLARKFHGVFPGLTIRLLALANRLLPTVGGIGSRRAKGSDSTSAWSPSIWTVLGDRAAFRNNEDGGGR